MILETVDGIRFSFFNVETVPLLTMHNLIDHLPFGGSRSRSPRHMQIEGEMWCRLRPTYRFPAPVSEPKYGIRGEPVSSANL